MHTDETSRGTAGEHNRRVGVEVFGTQLMVGFVELDINDGARRRDFGCEGVLRRWPSAELEEGSPKVPESQTNARNVAVEGRLDPRARRRQDGVVLLLPSNCHGKGSARLNLCEHMPQVVGECKVCETCEDMAQVVSECKVWDGCRASPLAQIAYASPA